MYEKQKYLLLKSLDFSNDLLEKLKLCNAIIAGGAVRSVFARESISDYDIYFREQKDLDKFTTYLSGSNFIRKFTTDTAWSYQLDEIKLQVIIMPEMICSPEKIIEQFDYTVCMAAYDFKTESFILGEHFLEHLAMKELFFNESANFPLASMFRLRKYIRKGYNISGTEVIKLGLTVHNLKLNNYKDLRKQLQGIDTLFLKELTDKLMSPEYAEKSYDFDTFMVWLDQYFGEQLDSIFD